MSEQLLAEHGGSFRIRVRHKHPPRELDVRVENNIEGARFEYYRILANQEWLDLNSESTVMRASRNDTDAHPWFKKRIGDVFYSIYGYYGHYTGLDGEMCIGDFKTLNQALVILEGIGLITSIDRRILLVTTKKMENVR